MRSEANCCQDGAETVCICGASAMAPFLLGAGFAAAAAYVGLSARGGGGSVLPAEVKAFGVLVLGVFSYVAFASREDIAAMIFTPGSDVLAEWLPSSLAGAAAGYVAWRALSRDGADDEPVLGDAVRAGAFPGAFFAVVAAFASQEFCLTALARPGGLAAWLPTLALAVGVGLLAYCGQAMAGGRRLPVAQAAAAVLALAYVAAVLTGFVAAAAAEVEPAVVEPPKKHKGKKKEAVAAAPATVTPDFVFENTPMVASAVLTAVLLWRLLSRPKGEPVLARSVVTGPVPASVMVTALVFACNSVYKAASAQEGGFDSLLGLIGLAAGSGSLAAVGVALQG